MSFTGKEGASITKQQALSMINRYEAKVDEKEARSHFVGRQLLDEILVLKDCVGLRIFHAENSDGQREIVITGEDAQGNIMTPGEGMTPSSQGNPYGYPHLVDESLPCPSACNYIFS